jgi:O-antigen/teichoic acid export membrane protein
MLKRVLKIISVMGLVVSVVVIVGSDYLMTLPFSKAYIDASPIFRILTLVFYFNLLCSVYTYAVIGMNRENIYTVALIYGMVIFLACVFPLTKLYGAAGSAAAYGIFQFVTFIVMHFKLKRIINIQIIRPVIIPAFISLIIIFILVPITDINIIYKLLISFIAGAPLISYSGGLDMKELKSIKRAFI